MEPPGAPFCLWTSCLAWAVMSQTGTHAKVGSRQALAEFVMCPKLRFFVHFNPPQHLLLNFWQRSVLYSNLHSHQQACLSQESSTRLTLFGRNPGDGQLQNGDCRDDRGSKQQDAWIDWEEVNKGLVLLFLKLSKHTFFKLEGIILVLVAVIWIAFSEEKAVRFITKYLLF